jgi:hypothetical protein
MPSAIVIRRVALTDPEDGKYLQGYVRAWATIVLLAGTVIGVALILIGSDHRLPSLLKLVLPAVGTSVIASLILYVLVSLFIDPKRQLVQAREAVRYGIDAANRQFTQRFEVALPSAVFEGSRIPKRSFRDAFVEVLCSSTRYDFKGDSASFTTYRLARCADHPEIRRLDQIRICLLDPISFQAIDAYAEQYLREDGATYSSSRVAEKAHEIRTDIYVSLWTLYRIRDRITATVYFHSDLPVFRCELFDDSMFLTYYLDRSIYPEYPETLQFTSVTRPYRAYSSALALCRHFAQRAAVFGERAPEADLINSETKFLDLLNSLGCEIGTSELKTREEQRFAKYDSLLKEGGLSVTDIF